MKSKPLPMMQPHKPKRIVLSPPEDLTEEELQEWQQEDEDAPEAYRQGHFLILYMREEETSMVADLNGKSLLHHQGALGEVSAILNAIQNTKWQNERIYEKTFQSLSDDEFMDLGMTVMDSLTTGEDVDFDDAADIENLTHPQGGNFLDDLIKPPKKKS